MHIYIFMCVFAYACISAYIPAAGKHSLGRFPSSLPSDKSREAFLKSRQHCDSGCSSQLSFHYHIHQKPSTHSFPTSQLPSGASNATCHPASLLSWEQDSDYRGVWLGGTSLNEEVGELPFPADICCQVSDLSCSCCKVSLLSSSFSIRYCGQEPPECSNAQSLPLQA